MEENVPSALAEAIPSFVKLGLIMPEGVDANQLMVPSSPTTITGMPNLRWA